MSDLTIKLLNLIEEGKTSNEIANELNISNKQLYNYLTMIRNIGYDFERKYYYDGSIIYIPKKNIESKNREVNLITSKQDTEIKALIISDTHLGSTKEINTNIAFDYCIKNGINIIIHTGDMVNGMIWRNNTIHNSNYEQIKYMIKNYPFDKNIITFIVLGNHDLESLTNTGQDINLILNSYRHDIVSLGYGFGSLNIKNDKIYVKHPLDGKYTNKQLLNNALVLTGNSHKMKINISSNNYVELFIPTLSNIFTSPNEIYPSAVKMILKMNNGVFINGYFEHLLFGDRISCINRIKIDLGRGKTIKKEISNEEEICKKLIKK